MKDSVCAMPSHSSTEQMVCTYNVHIGGIVSYSIVANARITPEMLQYINKLVTSFGVTIDQSNTGPTSLDAVRRAQAANDPAFQRLKNQFASDFDFRFFKYFVKVTITMFIVLLVPNVSMP